MAKKSGKHKIYMYVYKIYMYGGRSLTISIFFYCLQPMHE